MADIYTSTPQPMQSGPNTDVSYSVATALLSSWVNNRTVTLHQMPLFAQMNRQLKVQKYAKNSHPPSRQLKWALCTSLTLAVVETRQGCIILLCVPLRIRLALYMFHSALSSPWVLTT